MERRRLRTFFNRSRMQHYILRLRSFCAGLLYFQSNFPFSFTSGLLSFDYIDWKFGGGVP